MALKKNASAGARAAAANRAKAGSAASAVKAQNKTTFGNTNTINRSIPAPINQSMVKPMKTVNLVDSQNAVITKAQKEYGEASTRGDTAGMLAANARAEGARRLGGTIQPQTAGRTQTFTPTPGIDPTTGKSNTTVTGGVPIPTMAGTSSFQSSPTKATPEELDLSILRKQLSKQLEGSGFSDAEIDRLARKKYEAMNKDSTVKEAEEAQRKTQEEADRFARDEQRRLESEQRRLMSATDRATRNYAEQIDPIFQPGRDQAIREGGQRSSIQQRLMGAQGIGTSQFAVQELGKIETEITNTVKAIDSEKEAKVALYRAQREGADAQTQMALMQGVSNARIAANNAKQQSITDLFNLRLEAEQIGDENFMAFTEQLAEQMIADTDPIDIEKSKREGYFLYTDGQPYFDSSGKTVAYDSGWEKSGLVKSAGGQQGYLYVNPNTLEHKLIPLPAGDAPRTTGPGGGKQAVYDINTGETIFVPKGTPLKAGQIFTSESNQAAGIIEDAGTRALGNSDSGRSIDGD